MPTTSISPASAASPHRLDRIWVFALTDLSVGRTVAGEKSLGFSDTVELMVRAKCAGYNGIVLYDFGFAAIDLMSDEYCQNLRNIRVEGARLGLDVIPTVISLGAAVLQNDPNLAEGVPVRDSVFKVRNSQQQRVAVISDKEEKVRDGGLDRNEDLDSWTQSSDGATPIVTIDSDTKHSGDGSLRIEHVDQRSIWGMSQDLKLLPWHQYRFQIDVKFDEFAMDKEYDDRAF